jgi:hypothetical protein
MPSLRQNIGQPNALYDAGIELARTEKEYLKALAAWEGQVSRPPGLVPAAELSLTKAALSYWTWRLAHAEWELECQLAEAARSAQVGKGER